MRFEGAAVDGLANPPTAPYACATNQGGKKEEETPTTQCKQESVELNFTDLPRLLDDDDSSDSSSEDDDESTIEDQEEEDVFSSKSRGRVYVGEKKHLEEF